MLTRDIWESLGTRVVIFAFGAIGSILLTRALGPEGRGYYLGVVNLIALGTQFGSLGLGSSNTYYLSGGREEGPALVGNTWIVALALGSLLALLGWAAALQVHGLRAGVGTLYLVAGLATIPLTILLLLGQNLLIAKGAIRASNGLDVVRNLGWVGLVLIFAVGLGWGHRAAILLNLIVFGLANLWLWGRLAALGLPPTLRWDGALFQRTVAYGLKAYTVTLLGFLVLRLDALLVQHWLGAAAAGQYGVAVQLGDLLLTIGSTVAMILFPKAAELGPAAWPLVRRVTLQTSLGVGVLCLAGYVLAPWGVRLLFGPAFAPAVGGFRLLLPGLWCLTVETLLVQYLNGIGLPRTVLLGWVGALGLNVGLNVLWIPRMGIQGAALASTVAYAFMMLVVMVLVARALPKAQENRK